jgi:2-phosphoglycolate phosphatase
LSAPRELLDRARALVFDLDGTLVDTVDDLWLALNSALHRHGHAPASRETVLASLHGGLGETVRVALQPKELAPSDVAAVQDTYLTHYRDRRHAASRLYRGVQELLLDGHRRCEMAVCTNKSKAEAIDLLSALGIRHLFADVVGADSCSAMKPDPAPLRLVLDRLGVQADEALFIGDSAVDLMCAMSAGVRFLLHEGGYGREAALALGCSRGFASYEELVALKCR